MAAGEVDAERPKIYERAEAAPSAVMAGVSSIGLGFLRLASIFGIADAPDEPTYAVNAVPETAIPITKICTIRGVHLYSLCPPSKLKMKVVFMQSYFRKLITQIGQNKKELKFGC